MKFEGTYTYLMDTPSGKRETKVVIRKGSRAYEGELIGWTEHMPHHEHHEEKK